MIMAFWQLVAGAQTEAIARLDTNSLLIGDQIPLEISFSCPADYQVIWPALRDTITGQIEVVRKSPIDSLVSSTTGNKSYHQIVTITSFDSGYFPIPPIRFNYKKPGDTVLHFTETEALLLEVKTVPVNMEQEIKDIKEPFAAPFTFREALPYILTLLAVVLVVFLVIYYLKKRKKAEPVFRVVAKPNIPPHRIALDALETLRYKKLWQSGQIKEYHTELIDIIREYLFGTFGIHALEYTSDEIMDAVNKTAANPQIKEKLRQTLTMADMVKFAKMQPLPIEHDTSLNYAIDFVKETMHLTSVPVNGKEEKTDEKEFRNAAGQLITAAAKDKVQNEDGKEVKDVR